MVRTVKSITLTPEERRQAGYDREKTSSHACSVMLPNGASCEVSYTRTSARLHAFAFGDPLSRTRYAYEEIPGGTAGIEGKAKELAEALCQEAQQQEQKAKRQKAPSSRAAQKGDGGPQISARLAEQLAGRYAACVRCAGGTLIRVGGTYDVPDGALREIEAGRHSAIRLINGQRLTVGICSRAAQRWEEPTFLGVPGCGQAASASGASVPACETEDPEDDAEEPGLLGNQEGDPILEGGDDE
jgi:hypothetical protein